MKKTVLALWLLVFTSILFPAGCEKKEEVQPIGPPDPKIVSYHSDDRISRQGPIKVVFTSDLAAPHLIDQVLEPSPFTFTPAITGKALFQNPRTLVFIPSPRLPGGNNFDVSVDMTAFLPKEAENAVFGFKFRTIEPDFDITHDNLEPVAPDKLQFQRLTGKITTADTAEAGEVEKVLKAVQEGKALAVTWTHAGDKRSHLFTVDGIQRGENPSQVELTWDGASMEVKKTGKETIEVPALQAFSMSGFQVLEKEERHLAVQFSDPLEKNQDLRGLIRVGNLTELRFEIIDNSVHIYSLTGLSGSNTVSLEPGIRNSMGKKLPEPVSFEVNFEPMKPQVRFAGKGVILPTSRELVLPIEAVNLRAVTVSALHIYETSIPQFLQVNTLDGEKELKRVGRTVWKKKIPLETPPDKNNQWVRYGLDLASLVEKNTHGIFRLQLTFGREDIIYPCKGEPAPLKNAAPSALPDATETDSEDDELEDSLWDSVENYYGDSEYEDSYDQRTNPCSRSYYRRYYDHNITVARNVLISDIGLIAKRGTDKILFAAATGIRSAAPLAGAELTLLDYQQQVISQGKTDEQGLARLSFERKPYLLVANQNGQTAYLRVDDGQALSLSHFDIAGQEVTEGMKGFIYGERGVWRPGDTIFLTLILLDETRTLPATHPVVFELRNPKGQIVKTHQTREALNGFYCFQTATAEDAPTGTWTVRAKAGGAVFEKSLRIETVMPNRLKVKLDLGPEGTQLEGGTIQGELSAAWLHGAIAKNLKSDVELNFSAVKTTFKNHEEYVFDDPAREYQPERQTVFEGSLDENGRVAIKAEISAKNLSPGMLSADFRTRVFEYGGAFSVDRVSYPYHPYQRYVGLRLPPGDSARNMLLTDTRHPARIVLLDPRGKPVPKGRVKVELAKIKWRWWWDKGADELAGFASGDEYRPMAATELEVVNGQAEWPFEIKYPEWGRFFVRVTDLEGGHSTGRTFYADWPGWAGRGRQDMPGSASILSFSTDKTDYQVGEEAILTIPTGKEGRVLVSVESNSRVLHTAWVRPEGETTRYRLKTTPEMAPNVYLHATYLQPHGQGTNDLPIRLYGVTRMNVHDPATRLAPVIRSPEVLVPGQKAGITVSEDSHRPMTYTLALVDEGLLDLTRFNTPDPWAYFYQTVALGVKTWDLFDLVSGAYGGKLEKLLAIGGDEALMDNAKKKARRFPPLVRFIGPFHLEADGARTHEIDIPPTIGSVRIMLVAAHEKSFGFAEKAVHVRKPLMVASTLPRVLGPEETVAFPITVFAMDPGIRDVTVRIRTEGPLAAEGETEKRIAFTTQGEEVVEMKLAAGAQPGIARVFVTAEDGGESAAETTEIDVRANSEPVTEVVHGTIETGGVFEREINLPGRPGTNSASLEISAFMPMDIGKRLDYLIHYPHGCLEQTVSAAFPQLYLGELLRLSPRKQDQVQRHIETALQKLRSFQSLNGGFQYWPGDQRTEDWVSNYAGHFLVEAEKTGYLVPRQMISQWLAYQRAKSRSWVTGTVASELIQAYRLFTLALAGDPDLGAMNRLRESKDLPVTAKWNLAAAYFMAGQPEAAAQLAKAGDTTVAPYRELANTYGSDLRDKAMILQAMCLMNRAGEGEAIAREISASLTGDKWLSTQSGAYELMAMARYSGALTGARMDFEYAWNGSPVAPVSDSTPAIQIPLEPGGGTSGKLTIRNTGSTTLYPRLLLRGIPAMGAETASENGLGMSMVFLDSSGRDLDPVTIEQGTDFTARVTIRNTGQAGAYEAVALSEVFPSGWEIRNLRLDPAVESDNHLFEYQDVRDDRVYTYFHIGQGESRTYSVLLNAAYRGKFYLPLIKTEAMYDGTIHARIPGKWVEVVKAGIQ
ncbi:MAG: alpha-2-macroglobulin family protein [Thermodesulfobacteriota bacterium]